MENKIAPRPMKAGPSQAVYDTVLELGKTAKESDILKYYSVVYDTGLTKAQITKAIGNCVYRGYLVTDGEYVSISKYDYWNKVYTMRRDRGRALAQCKRTKTQSQKIKQIAKPVIAKPKEVEGKWWDKTLNATKVLMVLFFGSALGSLAGSILQFYLEK